MKTRCLYPLIACLFWLAFANVNVCPAQVLFGSIVGNVKDVSDAAIADAVVTLSNVDTKQARSSATSDTGSYDFATVLPGNFELRVVKAGFSALTRGGIVVSANNTVRLDVTLTIGAVAESVTISGAAAVLQTDRSDVRTDLGSAELANLPLSVGRNYQT